MKKILFFFAVLTATIFSSCEEMKSREYTVTVLQEIDAPVLIQPYRVFKTLTEGGDTVEAIVTEEVILKNRLPYKAIMEKSPSARYGWVKRTK